MPATCCCHDWIARLARDHAGQLAGIARREGAGPTEALDVVQDAFQTLLERRGEVAVREDPAAAVRLLGTIVRNAARNLRRRHHRARPHVELDATALAADAAPADAALDHARDLVQLAGCLGTLGEAHRAVVTLRVLEELSGDEASRALGLSPGHVAVLLHRARKELERCMLAP
jgi:RNA polymerase sigma-70 factor (ECF subfamily)